MECNYKWAEDNLTPIVKRKKQKRDSKYTLIFPSAKIKEAKFQSSEQISTFLLNNALQIGFCNWQIFEKALIDKGDYIKIIYKCRKKYCESILIYRQKKIHHLNPKEVQDQNYCLTEQKIDNSHNHAIRLTPVIANEQNIRQYLYDLPVEDKIENHVEAIKQKFNLTVCQARYLKERVFWKFKDEDHMVKKLAERRVKFRREIVDGKTTILLLVSETMKASYQKYGDVICFDITYKLLKKKIGQTRHLGVGFFVGQDQNTRIVLFALSMIEREDSANFQKLFRFFFEIMERPPVTILTDDQIALGVAIQRVKREKNYSYVHLLDWFHKAEALKRAIRREPFHDQIMNLGFRLFKESSKEVYLDILTEMAEMFQSESVMREFIKGHHQYCLAFAPEVFIAFGIATSRAESFNNLIKKSVVFQTNVSRLVYFVLRVQKRLLNRTAVLNYMNPEIFKNITDKEILMLSENLEHLAFEQVRQYYEESRMLQVVPTESPIHKKIIYYKYERQYSFKLMYDLKYNCWRCECKNNFRTGMPCSHLFAVIRLNRGSYSYYINQRWFHDKSDARVKKASRPKTRSKQI